MCTKETNGIFARERDTPCKRTVFATHLTAVKYLRSSFVVLNEEKENGNQEERINSTEINRSIDIRESEYSHSEKLLMRLRTFISTSLQSRAALLSIENIL